MSTIWIEDQHASILDYSANVKGARAVVSIRVEVRDAHALGSLLNNLDRSKTAAEPKRKADAAGQKEARQSEKKQRALRDKEPLLALPYFGDKQP